MRLFAYLPLLLLAACSQCQSSSDKSSLGASSNALERSARTPSLTIPKVDMQGLTPEQKASFIEFTNDEICPCGCPKTFAGCLQNDSECPAGRLLANWMIGRLKTGFPQEMLAPAISQEIAGYSGKSVEFSPSSSGQKGPKDAHVEIVEFADFQCGACRLATGAINALMLSHKDVKLTFKHFPLARHDMAEKAAAAAEAAGKQGKYWEMHRALFSTQNYLSDSLIEGHARALGLDVKQFRNDQTDPATLKIIEDGKKEALKLKLEGTPALFFNGRPYHLSHEKDALELRLNMERVRASRGC